MATPYKMKYTNGKKADPTAFPFNEGLKQASASGKLKGKFKKAVDAAPNKMMAAPTATDPKMQEAMQKKVDQVVTKKVDDAVGGETNIYNMPNFKKTRGFSLRSGNNPSMSSFKMMGSSTPSPITSPANMNNFGIGRSTSPLDFNPKGKSKEEIKAEQAKLGVNADGIWGPKSKAASAEVDKGAGNNVIVGDSEPADQKYQAPQKGDGSEEDGKGGFMKNAATVLMGGLDAVYEPKKSSASGRVTGFPTNSARLKAKKNDDKASEDASKSKGKNLSDAITGLNP